jgi:hypothetical protein
MHTDKIMILTEVFGEPLHQGREYLFSCPSADCKQDGKKKLSVNFEKEKFQCWRCGYAGRNLDKLFFDYAPNFLEAWQLACGKKIISSLEEIRQLIINEGKKDIPEYDDGYLKIISDIRNQLKENRTDLIVEAEKSIFSQIARRYMFQRGFDELDLLKYQVRFCFTGELAERVIVPSFDLEGNINYFVARSWSSNWKRYQNPEVPKQNIIFNEFFVKWDKEIVLTEGVFDAMKLGMEHAIPLLGSSFSEDSRLFKKILEHSPKIILALDDDEVGKIYKILTGHGLKVVFFNKLYFKDLGEMPKHLAQEQLSKAVQLCSEESVYVNMRDRINNI